MCSGTGMTPQGNLDPLTEDLDLSSEPSDTKTLQYSPESQERASNRFFVEYPEYDTLVTKKCPGMAAAARGDWEFSKRFGGTYWSIEPKNRKLMLEAFHHAASTRQVPTTTIARNSFHYNMLLLQSTSWILSGEQLHYARERGIISHLPNCASESIKDQSTGDIFTKCLAVVQVVWLTFQLITRKAEGLSCTHLELVAVGYAALALISYGFLFAKPQDVHTTRLLDASRYPDRQEMIDLASKGFDRYHHQLPYIFELPRIYKGGRLLLLLYLAGSGGAMLFGGLHCLAWDLQFPTYVEKIVWRVVSIFTASLGLVAISLWSDIRRGHDWESRRESWRRTGGSIGKLAGDVYLASVFLFWSGYMAGRLFIMVEMFRALCFQPADAFRTTWSTALPHIG